MPGSILVTGDMALSNQTRFLLPRVDTLVTEGQGYNHIREIKALRKRHGVMMLTVPKMRSASLV